MGITVSVDIAFQLTSMPGQEAEEQHMVADSMHTQSDVLASVGVILGLVAVQDGLFTCRPVIALLICGLVLLTGLNCKETASKVSGRSTGGVNFIVDLAKSVEGVSDCHQVRTRGVAGEIFVDLHMGL